VDVDDVLVANGAGDEEEGDDDDADDDADDEEEEGKFPAAQKYSSSISQVR